jgi:hypothetical protein
LPEEQPIENTEETPQPPDDFNEYIAFRKAEAEGKTAPEVKTPPAPAEKPEAKTAPTSGAERPQDQEEDEEEDEEEAVAEETKTPPKKGGYQKRIDKLTREKRALEARVAALEVPLAPDAGKRTSVEPPAAKTAPVVGEPKPDDFDTYEEFTKAIIRWDRDQVEQQKAAKEAEERAVAAERRAAEAHRDMLAAWKTRAAETKKAHPDYDEVMDTAGDLPIPDHMNLAILRHPDGPRLAYELAKDREEAERIAAIQDPIEASVAIGAYAAAKIGKSQPVSKPKAPITGAPKPVTPLRNGRPGGTTSDIHDPDLAGDYNAWERARRAQLKDR